MDYLLNVSDEAARNVRGIVKYLRSEWTERSVLKLESDLIKAFESILDNPQSFLLISKEKGIRKYKLPKYSSIYYRVKENEIEVITIFDHRRDPDKLKEVFNSF